jgi:hypothetical protein
MPQQGARTSHSYDAQERANSYWGHMQDTCESCSCSHMMFCTVMQHIAAAGIPSGALPSCCIAM